MSTTQATPPPPMLCTSHIVLPYCRTHPYTFPLMPEMLANLFKNRWICEARNNHCLHFMFLSLALNYDMHQWMFMHQTLVTWCLITTWIHQCIVYTHQQAELLTVLFRGVADPLQYGPLQVRVLQQSRDWKLWQQADYPLWLWPSPCFCCTLKQHTQGEPDIACGECQWGSWSQRGARDPWWCTFLTAGFQHQCDIPT